MSRTPVPEALSIEGLISAAAQTEAPGPETTPGAAPTVERGSQPASLGLSTLDRPAYLDFIPTIPSNRAWASEAICPTTDPELFFPEKGASTKAAKAICDGCPVRRQCLTWALEVEQIIGPMPGIYGGKTTRERKPEVGQLRQCRWYDCTKDRKSVSAVYCDEHADEAKKRTRVASDRRRRARQRKQRTAGRAAA
jgi:hypothetical protein